MFLSSFKNTYQRFTVSFETWGKPYLKDHLSYCASSDFCRFSPICLQFSEFPKLSVFLISHRGDSTSCDLFKYDPRRVSYLKREELQQAMREISITDTRRCLNVSAELESVWQTMCWFMKSTDNALAIGTGIVDITATDELGTQQRGLEDP